MTKNEGACRAAQADTQYSALTRTTHATRSASTQAVVGAEGATLAYRWGRHADEQTGVYAAPHLSAAPSAALIIVDRWIVWAGPSARARARQLQIYMDRAGGQQA
jgi:hypothetical protein